MMKYADQIRAVEWRDDVLYLLDQRKLPQVEERLALSDCSAVTNAIRDMVVRGAPAIGVTAAFAVVLAAKTHYQENTEDWLSKFHQEIAALKEARPTAVNLGWAIERMLRTLNALSGDPVPGLLAQARAIQHEDIQSNLCMGELGAAMIESGSGVLTHCNTGSLATGGYGTALGVIRSAWKAGKLTSVFADETRPWLQGARLTAWELVKDKIPVTLIVEGAAAHLMKQGKVHWVIVGSDRIAANGDVVNKIGTYSAAIAARFHGVRFMVVAPTSTIDMSIASGAQIPIEARSRNEIFCANGVQIAAAGADAWNPAFDVTPASLVDAIVTERGVVEKPNLSKMTALMGCQ